MDLLLNTMVRLGRGAQEPYYERAVVGVAFHFAKYFSITPLYSYIWNQPLGGTPNRENRIAVEAAVELPFGRWTVGERNVFERRFMPPKDSTRYKNRVEIARRIKETGRPLSVYVADEVVYDWSVNAWARNRISIGGRQSLNKKVSLDVYYMLQNRLRTRPTTAHIVGITVNMRFKDKSP